MNFGQKLIFENLDNIIIKIIIFIIKIAVRLLAFFGLIYMAELILQPLANIYSFVITILGITVVLSGACFSASRAFRFSKIKSILISSGKDFLLSALLMILLLSLIFIKKDAFNLLPKKIEIKMIKERIVLTFILNYLFIVFIASIGSIIWYQGFSRLTMWLLDEWQMRKKL
ncbi:MAG: hypothetical protein ACPLXO_04450 [Desulfurella sp.]